MTTIRAAFYARVSGEQQAAAHTIESQIAALSERASSDGMPVPPERQFVDDGYSSATLIRPALDRLRDLVNIGAIDRIYVHSPDRLARNYAYQVLVLDEWRRRGVEVVFLNRLAVLESNLGLAANTLDGRLVHPRCGPPAPGLVQHHRRHTPAA